LTDEQSPDQPPSHPPGSGPIHLNDAYRNQIPVNIEDEMRKSYLDYAMSVIIGRALPDVRDGLKPVHRRILFGMSELGLSYTRPTRKSAKIVGEVMGKFHPHGDGAIYDALVRMAQPFSMRYPLVDGQGNFGSVDGDPPAAMRYTEARLSKITATMLDDIDKETVDFRANYDDSEHEPEVLPARAPNLLINGSSGIAVGMATNIPPHNIREIIDATILLINNPNATLAEVLAIVPGPDFPTGGFILGRSGILDAYSRGRGSIKMRARAEIEKSGKDRETIVVTELPYQVNKARMIEATAGLVNEKKIEGISEIRDESDRDGMRIVFELKRGEQADIVLNNLYKHTQMQINFGVIMLSIVNGQPRELGLVDMIKRFIDHRVEVVRRRTNYLLRKAREREHTLLGFRRALQNLDQVITIIRASRTPREARDGLIAFISPDEAAGCAALVDATGPQFTERQAQAIIELQLQRLTGMEQDKILKELEDIQRMIAEYLGILGSETRLLEVITDELAEMRKDFGDERRTQIIEETGEIMLEDLIQQEDVAITVTRGGYLKRTAVDTYRRQILGGKGRIGMTTRQEDVVEHLIIASTHNYMLMFTTEGRLYWLKNYVIPDSGTASKGRHISGLINLQPGEGVKAFLTVKEFTAGKYVIMVTRNGVIKKSELTEFDNPMTRGIIAIGIDEGDELIQVMISEGNNNVICGTRQGMAIRFAESEVRPMGRPARGVKAMELDAGDYIVGAEVTEAEGLILAISENGFGKRTPIQDYRLTHRGGRGVINMKTTNKVGHVMAIMKVTDNTDLMIITAEGKIIRIESGKIRQAGRSTQGVRLVRMEEGDRVAAACKVPDSASAQDAECGVQ
jgi:DNA gyrase subunit A